MNQKIPTKEEVILERKRKTAESAYGKLLLKRLAGQISVLEFVEGAEALGINMTAERIFYQKKGMI